MAILVSQERFLQSKAQMLVLPVSADGQISHATVAHCCRLFVQNYEQYRKKATAGELMLGEVLVHRLQSQAGLGASTTSVDYVANMVVQQFAEHVVSVRMLRTCLVALKPKLYELMRYQGLRRVAILGSALVREGGVLDATQVVQVCDEVLGDVPKLTVEVYFSKEMSLPVLQKVLET